LANQTDLGIAGATDGDAAAHRSPISRHLVDGTLRVADVLILTASAGLAYVAYLGLYVGEDESTWGNYGFVVLVGAFLQVNLFSLMGVYARTPAQMPRLRLLRVVGLWTALFSLLIIIGFLTKTSEQFSRGWVLSWYAIGLVGITGSRALLAGQMARWHAQGRFLRRVAVIGTGEQMGKVLDWFNVDQKSNYAIAGIFSVEDRITPAAAERESSEMQVSGNVEDLIEAVRCGRVDEILVALPWAEEETLLSLFPKLSVLPVNVRLAPDSIIFKLPQYSFKSLTQAPILTIMNRPLTGVDNFYKRWEDWMLAGAILLSSLPFILLIAGLIKVTSPGPVIFRQQRYGFNNRLFELLKFRTMYDDQRDLHADAQTTLGDPRVTPLGKFLRRWSLDELPQLFNVLKGDMSLVGPRPHAILTKAEGQLFEDVVQEYTSRHRVKPGITGWAQVNGYRGETDTLDKIRGRVSYDLYYIENWSLGFDLRILVRTVLVVLMGKNAY
jgi:Undecaprenyl-phosphate glucose phosphotransferase